MIQTLLDHGADPNMPDEYITPLIAAIRMCEAHKELSIKTVTLLLNRHTQVNRRYIEFGAQKKSAPFQTTLPLIEAAVKGDKEMIQLLLDHGADVNGCSDGRHIATPLMYATGSGNIDTMQALLENGAKVNQRALTIAHRNNNKAAIELLRHYGAKFKNDDTDSSDSDLDEMF